MVCLADRDNLPAKSSMAVAPERTTTAAGKALHNFDMPWLRWGSQRYLRCMKVNNSSARNVADGSHRRSEGFGMEASPITAARWESRRKKSLRVGGGLGGGDENGEGIAAIREKLLGDLKVAAAKMKDAIFRDGAASVDVGVEDNEVDEDGSTAAAVLKAAAAAAEEEEEETESRPWNLRTRRAACKAPTEDRKVISSSSSPEKTQSKKREKFSPGLSKKEIEADFMAFLGHKPARRPKKRPRNVQRQLDFLLPGFLLTEITTDTYRVSENPETSKR